MYGSLLFDIFFVKEYIKTDWFGAAGVDEGVYFVYGFKWFSFTQRIWNFLYGILFFHRIEDNLCKKWNIFKASFNLHIKALTG